MPEVTTRDLKKSQPTARKPQVLAAPLQYLIIDVCKPQSARLIMTAQSVLQSRDNDAKKANARPKLENSFRYNNFFPKDDRDRFS